MNIEWLAGFYTFDSISDDRYQLSGSLDMGSTVSDFLLKSVVNQAIIIDHACDVLFESGRLTLTLEAENESAIIIDFIDSDCDNLFQCTFDCNGNPTSFFYPIK